MNEEELEKTRALNELAELVKEKNNELDTKDIEIPDDINNVDENKESLYKDLTSEEIKENDKKNKKKKFDIKNIKKWWKKLSKKQKIIFVSVAVLVLILIVTLIVVLVTKKHEIVEEKNVENVVLEADNYVYQNGKLTMIDKNGNAIGNYECVNKDENKCYVAYLSNSEDPFETPINKYTNDEIIKTRSSIYYDRYVFIYDNESENDTKIKLYDMRDNQDLNEYYGVKSYSVENSNVVILKDETDSYGLFELKNDGIEKIIDFKYQFMGLIDKDKDDLIVVKDSKGYYLIDYKDTIKTKVFNDEIVDYNDTYIVVKNKNDKYTVYNYTQEEFNKDYDYIRLLTNDYVIVVKDKNLYVRGYSDNKFNEEGYELTNSNYRKIYVFDNDKKLVSTEFAFDTELHDKTLTLTIKNTDATTREEKVNLVEGDVSSKYAYYSYFNGKLFIYDDEEKTNLIGSYECNNKNNITGETFNNCYIARNSVFNDSYINPAYEDNSVLPVYNKKYVFIMDAPDLQNDSNTEIKFYDLKQNKVLGTYSAIDAGMKSNINDLTFEDTNDTQIIARLKSGKFGVIKVNGEDASVLYKFNYNYIERAKNDYIVQLESNNWGVIYGSNGYPSSEFPGRIKNYTNGYFVIKNNERDYIYKADGSRLIDNGFDYIDITNNTIFATVSSNQLNIYKYDDTKQPINTDAIYLKSSKYYNTTTPAYKISTTSSTVTVFIYNSDGTLSATKTYSLEKQEEKQTNQSAEQNQVEGEESNEQE